MSRTQRAGRLSKWQRRAVLLAFSLVFACVVIGGLEGILRIAGYGGYPSTFTKAGTLKDGSELVFTSREGPASYFFANRSLPGTLIPTAFVSPKPEGTVRIVLVGASAMRGSPYPRPLTSGAFLEAMLEDVWPERNVEVINLGTTAVASYPVLGIMTEALAYEPDLVVAYVGNNEFYGAFGVASLHSAGRSPKMIRLIRRTRSLAIAQFIDDQFRSANTADSRTLMEAMVGQGSISQDDPTRTDAAANLEEFVGDMIERCQAQSVPILVCTPPANERGLAPLGKLEPPDMASVDASALEEALTEAEESLPTDPVQSEAAARRAIALFADQAIAHHILGRALYDQQEFIEAAAAFQRSVDLDPMPWRPPSNSVSAIRQAASDHGAPLCDLVEAFRESSPGGSIGWELMNDHVHPSLRGQALVAQSIVQSLGEMEGPLHVDSTLAEELPDWQVYADRLGTSDYIEFKAAFSMRSLASIPFFQQTNPAFFERFDQVCTQIATGAPPHVQEQLRAWTDPTINIGQEQPITGLVGRALYDLGEMEQAERAFRVAAASVDPYTSWDLKYTYFTMLCRLETKGALDEHDLATVREAIDRGYVFLASGTSTTGEGERFTGELLQLDGKYSESIAPLLTARIKFTELNRVAADRSLVRAYMQTGKVQAARSLVDRGLQGDRRYVTYYKGLAEMIRSVEGDP